MKYINLFLAFLLVVIGISEKEPTNSAIVMTGAVIVLAVWIAQEDILNKLKNKPNDKPQN